MKTKEKLLYNHKQTIKNQKLTLHLLTLMMLCMGSIIACEESTTNKSSSIPTQNTLSDDSMNQDTMSQDETPTTSTTGSDQCMPSQSDWPNMQKLVQNYCATCHDQTPQFGAPFALTEFTDWTQDRINLAIDELSQGNMPPIGQPLMLTQDRLALIDWLSCGEVMESDIARPAGGFDSSHPILTAPNDIPTGTDFFEVRAQEYKVPVDKEDHYECFTIAAPLDEDRFIRRIETLIDDARVLHHVVVIPSAGGREINSHSSCDRDNPLSLIYGWAPGQGALHFEAGGIRLKPGQELTLQIHYNNSANLDDAIDSSGVRIYHGPVEGPEVAVLTLGPLEFEIPPRSRGEAVGYCEVPKNTKLVASFPHMHEFGSAFHQAVIRQGAVRPTETEENLISLDGWDFESQYIYDTPSDLESGDLIRTTCLFENTTDEPVNFGGKTSDEMCFNFAYISPPIGISFCDQKDPPQFNYIPGMCAPDDTKSWMPPRVTVGLSEPRALPTSSSEFLPNGMYLVDEAIVGTDLSLAERYNLDLEQSKVRIQGGSIWKQSDVTSTSEMSIQEAIFDLNTEIQVVGSGLSFNRAFPLSFTGNVFRGSESENTEDDESIENTAYPLTFNMTCGDDFEIEQVWTEIDTDQKGAWLSFPFNFGPVALTISVHVTKIEE